MKHNVISYLISEGLSNVLKNKKSTGASLTIMCATLLIFGLVFVIVANINYMVKNIEGQQGIRVFLQDVGKDERDKIEEKINSINGVNTVKYVSKAEALQENREKYGEKKHRTYYTTGILLGGLDQIRGSPDPGGGSQG